MPKVEDASKASWAVPDLPTWLKEAEKAPRWHIPGLLLEEAVVCMSGQKKRARKTMAAMEIALSLATGCRVGNNDKWTPLHASPVLFVEEEGPRAGTADRLSALCRAKGLQPEQLAGKFWLAFHHSVKLDKKGWREKLMAKVQETGAKLMVLDAIVYMHDGDENKTKDMQFVQETIRQIRGLGCTVMYLAHLDKTRGEDPKADVDSQVRGTGLFTDLMDQHIALRRYSDDDPVVQVTLKGKDVETKKASFRWLFESDPDGVLQRAILQVERPGESMERMVSEAAAKLAMDHKYTVTRLQELWSLPKNKVQIVIDHLSELRLIEKRDGAWWKAGGTQKAVSVGSA